MTVDHDENDERSNNFHLHIAHTQAQSSITKRGIAIGQFYFSSLFLSTIGHFLFCACLFSPRCRGDESLHFPLQFSIYQWPNDDQMIIIIEE